MSDYRVGVVVGSLRRHSFNRKLAAAMAKLGPPGILLPATANRRPAAL